MKMFDKTPSGMFSFYFFYYKPVRYQRQIKTTYREAIATIFFLAFFVILFCY